MKQFLRFPIIVVLEILLLILLKITGTYKSLFFISLFNSINQWQLPSSLKSLAILFSMFVPVFILIYIANLKFLKIPFKTLLYIHGGLVLLITAGLELFFLVI